MKHLTVNEVAAEIGVTPRTVRRWCNPNNCRVEHTRLPSGQIRFTAAQAEALEQAMRKTPAESHPEVETPNPLFAADRGNVVHISNRNPAA